MLIRNAAIRAALILLLAAQASAAGPFVLFPQTHELISPDGRSIIRNSDTEHPAQDFVGTFHTLWLTDTATGRTRKICDYVGIAAAAWSGNDHVLVTQYLSKKSSRALVFPAHFDQEPIVLDVTLLSRTAPDALRESLAKNDHAFVEVSRFEKGILSVRVWGYGRHDPTGFRWNCEYAAEQGTVTCIDAHAVSVR